MKSWLSVWSVYTGYINDQADAVANGSIACIFPLVVLNPCCCFNYPDDIHNYNIHDAIMNVTERLCYIVI